ncbi:DUF2851 family protein [Psychroserpens sp. SPM9]|uniref:DUF2851 family protein n=1 Tax=Psychroserpens sp. SPM9 TaxID=2975598 RepID=UPI0021A38125|nr:DUF2851 family protein [Psychroserpens sp. SPM9]MDG5489925.1 DUF2851 family protein [Psychroserpens sp. SPM9]
MKEDFLHYIWQHKKFNILNLKTTQHEPLEIISGGILNFHSGPDFFNGKLRIANQLWAGNIEIHIKSSNWFVHGHEQDASYDNVILHVVYEHDIDIFRKDNTIIPTLELKTRIDTTLLNTYYKLYLSNNKWINCEQDITSVSKFKISNWLERLYFERLERKSDMILEILKTSKNDWEGTLFKMLAKNFGLKVNGDSFFSVVNSFDFSVVRKTSSDALILEALFLGQSGLLDNTNGLDAYYLQLQNDYMFLKQKFQLNNQGVQPLRFFRLRPRNFPTIRWSQLAQLYHQEQQLFSKVIISNSLLELYQIFEVTTNPYWETHFTFGKEGKSSVKKVTKSFINLLLINTILPIKFCYHQQKGELKDEIILDIVRQITSEKNTIIDGFKRLNIMPESALESQALLELKTLYCDKNRCLKCAIGNALLSK